MSPAKFPAMPEIDGLEIKVVANEQELMKAFAVRAIVYMHGQSCPYDEEFDLNDFTATQILGTLNGDPVLTARIRYFAGFAKLERLAIREEHRGKGFGHALLRFMIEVCEKKGFRRFYLHAQSRLRPFYERYGFEVIGDDFSFSEHEYLEMAATYPVSQAGLTVECGPMMLNRPEGHWGRPGPLEKISEQKQSMEVV